MSETDTRKRNTVYVREDIHARLKVRAAVQGRKLGEIIDEILEQALANHATPQLEVVQS